MITDSHCHLASHKFSQEELPEIINRAKENEISRMVTLATNLEDCSANLDIADTFPEVFACIGIHPCDVHQTDDDYLEKIEQYSRHPRCVAIGETGLDYFHPAPEGWTEKDYHQRQQLFLEQHFELAARLGKNIVIHTRDKSGNGSLEDSIKIYSQYADEVRAVFHCWPHDLDTASPIFELGGIISFTGVATFKNATHVLDAASKCPEGSFMLETDSPYLAPVPHRGQRNEPAFTRKTAETIALAREESLSQLAAHTHNTANQFFNFPVKD